jgi:hypothetical protein
VSDIEVATQADEGELLYGGGSTSIFDPVLTEVCYRWFCPPGGRIIDPFAGGSVRGIVAARLGRRYEGVELREVQVEANRQQALDILTGAPAIVPDVPEDYMPEMTPVEEHGDIWMKREDYYAFGGVRGAKVRTCMFLVQKAKDAGVGVITAGSRQSPQVNFVAQIARAMGVKCRVHVPSGALTPELLAAKGARATVVQHEYGYNSVIIARARDDAEARGWVEVPYGMESPEAVEFTKPQVANVPRETRRLVNSVGSGMTLAGILWGLEEQGLDIPVLGVHVGHLPEERIDKYAPPGWRDRVEFVCDGTDYHDAAEVTEFRGVQLDPFYEAKCIPFLREGDLLWVSAIRPSVVAATCPDPRWITADACSPETWDEVEGDADFLFTCPPYGDLEVYSDDPADLSNMDWDAFVEGYRQAIDLSCAKLADDRFAAIVVGDFRDSDGYYRNFPGITVEAFEAAGLRLYNEAILVTQAASLPLRAGRQFDASRKLGKTHQNCLVFVKGDAWAATDAVGPIVGTDMAAAAEVPEVE